MRVRFPQEVRKSVKDGRPLRFLFALLFYVELLGIADETNGGAEAAGVAAIGL